MEDSFHHPTNNIISNHLRNYYINRASIYTSKRLNWMWLRIHKTAGTSVYEVLKGHCFNVANDDGESDDFIEGATDGLLNHILIWTIVRDPYDRFRSMAAMFKKDVNEFAYQFHSLREHNRVIERHTEPQHLFTHIGSYPIVDRVFRFENLLAEFSEFCKEFEIPFKGLQRLNTSGRMLSTEVEFSPNTIDLIHDVFRYDFEFFKYPKIYSDDK